MKAALQQAEVSEQTYYNWKNAAGKTAAPAAAKASSSDDLKALVALEAENLKLRKELAAKLRSENTELRKRLGKAYQTTHLGQPLPQPDHDTKQVPRRKAGHLFYFCTKCPTQNSSLAIRRVIRLIDEMNIHASADAIEASQSFARRRQRLSQAKVRSTIHRLGKTTKPLA